MNAVPRATISHYLAEVSLNSSMVLSTRNSNLHAQTFNLLMLLNFAPCKTDIRLQNAVFTAILIYWHNNPFHSTNGHPYLSTMHNVQP